MSVGEWLNTVILDSVDEEGLRPSRPDYDDGEDDNDQLVVVQERLDELTRQIDRLQRVPASRAPYAPAAQGPEAYAPPHYTQNQAQNRDHQLAEAIARLDQRMEQLVEASRAKEPAPVYIPVPAVPSYAPLPLDVSEAQAAAEADAWTPDIDLAMTEINARMRALDADPDAPPIVPPRQATPAPSAQAPSAAIPSQNLAGLEQHLRHITSQIEALRRQPQLEEGIAALRQALSDIARTLLDAMPKRAIEALEAEVRALGARLDSSRQAGADTAALSALERGLAEILDTLRTLRPAENLDSFRQAVHSMAQKIDMLGASTPDVNVFHQLESAVSALQSMVPQVASNDALAHLTAEVHALAQKVDQVAAAGGTDHGNALETLNQRVAHIADALESRGQNGGSVPPQLEALIQGLTDKIERLQHSRGDDAALGNLEDRIARLLEKLDASGARLDQLKAIEHGLADLLAQIENKRSAASNATEAPQVDGLQRDLVRTQSTLEAVHGTLGHVVDRLAMLESDMREKNQAQTPVSACTCICTCACACGGGCTGTCAAASGRTTRTARARRRSATGYPTPSPGRGDFPKPSRAVAHAQATAAMARANPKVARTPIDPNLPPDHPLEPGVNPAGRLAVSSADRIAASEAALAPGMSALTETSDKSHFIAAARRAARAAAAEPTTADLRAAARRPGSARQRPQDLQAAHAVALCRCKRHPYRGRRTAHRKQSDRLRLSKHAAEGGDHQPVAGKPA